MTSKIDEQVIAKTLHACKVPLTAKQLAKELGNGVTVDRLRYYLRQMEIECLIDVIGSGRNRKWAANEDTLDYAKHGDSDRAALKFKRGHYGVGEWPSVDVFKLPCRTVFESWGRR